MNIIQDYLTAKQAIYDHVGFTEDYVVCPIEDNTEFYWRLEGEGPGIIYFGETIEEIETFDSEIYTQRFYDKWVYRGEEYTMIFMNPQVDGMRYFGIFRNDKEVVRDIGKEILDGIKELKKREPN